MTPEVPGEATLRITLVRENIAWLDSVDGNNSVVARVELDPLPQSFADLDDEVCTRFPPPEHAFMEAYPAAHGRFVDFAVNTDAILDAFRSGRPLPRCYGAGLDERVIEYPWLLAQPLCGRLLDA